MAASNNPNPPRDIVAGTLLILGALGGVFALSLHPTAHDLLNADRAVGMAHLNVVVHSTALATIPMLFFGLLRLSRRLEFTDLATSALVAYGFGGVAVLSAAVVSGFVATGVLQRLVSGGDESRVVLETLAYYTGLLNQGYAKVYVVASSVAVLLFSAAILSGRRMHPSAGFAGVVAAGGVLIAFLSGLLSLGVHDFGILTFVQSGWFIWLGCLMLRQSGHG